MPRVRSPYVDARTLAGLTRALAALLLVATACSSGSVRPPTTSNEGMTFWSPAVTADGALPVEHTCDGEDLSPPLGWSEPPEEAVGLAISVIDRDADGSLADGFAHWVVFNVDPELRTLDPGLVPVGAVQSRNDLGANSYRGPCPPEGEGVHRYVFRIDAVSDRIQQAEGAPPADVLAAIARVSIAAGTFEATYQR